MDKNQQQTAGQQMQQVQQPEKLFTQDDVNRIVGERLARAKTAQEPDAREAEYKARENALYVREQIAEYGLPKELAEEFKGLDKETIDKCMKIIVPFVQKAKEPFLNPVNPTGSVSGTDSRGALIRQAMGLCRKA